MATGLKGHNDPPSGAPLIGCEEMGLALIEQAAVKPDTQILDVAVSAPLSNRCIETDGLGLRPRLNPINQIVLPRKALQLPGTESEQNHEAHSCGNSRPE